MITFKGVDEASAVANAVAGNMDKAMRQVAQASAQVEQANKKVDTSTKDIALAFNNVATSAFNLYNAYDRIHESEVMVDRANLMVKSSANAVEDAQTRLNTAVAKFGTDSPQAAAAAKDLEIAQDRNAVAMERAQIAQDNLSKSMLTAITSVVPTAITMFSSLAKIFGEGGISLGGFTAHAGLGTGALSSLTAGAVASAVGVAAGAAAVALSAAGLAQWVTMSEEARKKQVALDSENIVMRQSFMNAANSMDQCDGALNGLQTAFSQALDPIKKTDDALGAVEDKIRDVTDAEWACAAQIEKTGGSLESIGREILGHAKSLGEMSAASRELTKEQQALKDAVDAEAEAARRAAEAERAVAAALEARKAAFQASNTQDLAARSSQANAIMSHIQLYGAARLEAGTAKYAQDVLGIDVKGMIARQGAAQMQFGGEGIVSRPTLFLAGEAGPEAFSFRPMAKGGGGIGGGITIQGPLLVVEGSVDRATADYVLSKVGALLRSVAVEASSSFGSSTQKRIRMQPSKVGI